MKVSFAVAAVVGLIGRCSDWPVDPHHPWPGHQPPPAADDDAGVEDDRSCNSEKLGLYVDPYCKHLVHGVVPYAPSYELWADGADKQRYIFLPEGKTIDTTNPDRWNFPKGTRLYKTFSQNGVKLETRVFEKTAEPAAIGSWTLQAYAWREDQRFLDPVPDEGQSNLLKTDHDVPKKDECVRCHRRAGADIVNGFEAIQLNHAGRGWTLERLITQGRLVNGTSGAPANVTVDNAVVPGDPIARAALGYLHANCGNCHADSISSPPKTKALDLSLHVGNTALADAPAYKAAAACARLTNWKGPAQYLFIIEPGSAATSGVIGRMEARADMGFSPDQMPPIASEKPDETGIDHVSAWIDRLDTECVP